MPKRGGGFEENPSKKAVASAEDAWDEVANADESKGGDSGKFTRMNTNFFLSKGEKDVEIVFLDSAPTIFTGHTLACESSNGKQFWVTEACQKLNADSCLMCSSNNKNVSAKRKLIAFRLIDSRGAWDSDAGELDGEPTPKIFLAPVYLAKQIKGLKDDAGDEFNEIVFKLSKEGKNYVCSFAMRKTGKSMEFIEAPEFDGELPEVMDIYAPKDDEELLDFMEKFVIGFGSSNGSSTSSRDDSNRRGSFGK
jgi:hypothetical protein